MMSVLFGALGISFPEVTKKAMATWDERREYGKKYNCLPSVRKVRAQKVLKKLKAEKEKKLIDAQKGYGYGAGVGGPAAGKKKQNNETKVCRYCARPGHVRRTHKNCLYYKDRVAAKIAEKAKEKGKYSVL